MSRHLRADDSTYLYPGRLLTYTYDGNTRARARATAEVDKRSAIIGFGAGIGYIATVEGNAPVRVLVHRSD